MDLEDDKELYRELAGLFLQEYPRMHAELAAAVARRDPKGIEFHAHDIKGSILQFGEKAAAQAALRLELKGRAGELAGLEEGLADLDVGMKQALENLRDLNEGSDKIDSSQSDFHL